MHIPKSLKDFVMECGLFEKEHRKYSEFMATWSHTLSGADVEKYAESPEENIEWLPFVGLHIVLHGSWDDSYGSEIHGWDVFVEVETETKMSKDFWSLMSHLNSEDNDMAFEFSQKYLKPAVSYAPVKSPQLLAATVPAMCKAKAVSDE